MASNTPFTVNVHQFPSKARNSCAYELGSSSSRNAVIFIAGLGDGPHSVQVTRTVAKHLEPLGYSTFEFRMRSSYTGFGTSSLKNDVEDISSLVKYLRSLGKEKIVLFGHSTGCQVLAIPGRCPFVVHLLIILYSGLHGILKLCETWKSPGGWLCAPLASFRPRVPGCLLSRLEPPGGCACLTDDCRGKGKGIPASRLDAAYVRCTCLSVQDALPLRQRVGYLTERPEIPS